MMYKALGSIGEVPYCFSKSFINLLPICNMGQKLFVFYLNWAFPVWIHQRLWNDAQSFKQHRRGTVFFKVICQISMSRDKKSPISTCIKSLWTRTPVWIHRRFLLLDFQAEGVLPLPASVNPFISDSVTLDMLLENDRNFGEVINGTDIRPDWTHLS